MNGRINNPRIGLGLGGLEIGSIIAGLIVVLGVLLESGPEFWKSIAHATLPSRVALGGALVALGVFGEVAIGAFIARSARREKLESDLHIAATEERAANAERETAALQIDVADARERQERAEEALVFMRKGMSMRSVLFKWRDFAAVLERSETKGKVDVLYQPEDPEAYTLATLLENSFVMGGWQVRTPSMPAAQWLETHPVAESDHRPSVLRLGAHVMGITVIAASLEECAHPYALLKEAFNASGHVHLSATRDPSLSANDVRLVVAPKP